MQQQHEQYIHINEYGDKRYYKNQKMTKLHRLDGPAYEAANGYKAWYFDGKRLSEEAFRCSNIDNN